MRDRWQSLNNRITELRANEEIDEAIILAQEALNIARNFLEKNDIGYSLNASGNLYKTSNMRYEDAESCYLEAITIRRQLSDADSQGNLVINLVNLADLYITAGRSNQAASTYREAKDICHRLLFPTYDNYLPIIANNLAILYETQGQLDEAEFFYLESIEIDKRTFNNEGVFTSLLNLIELYIVREKSTEASRFYQEAKNIYQQIFLNTHGEYFAKIANNLAGLYESQGKLDEAESVYLDEIDIRCQLSGNTPDRKLAIKLNDLAAFYLNYGIKWIEAESLLLQANAILNELFDGTANVSIVLNLGHLGTLYTRQGRWKEAESILLEALKIYRQLSEETPDERSASIMVSLGNLYLEMGRYVDAEHFYLESYQIINKLSSPTAKRILATNLMSLGSLYTRQGQWVEAERTLTESLQIYEKLSDAAVVHEIAINYCRLAELSQLQSNWVKAKEEYLKALAIFRNCGVDICSQYFALALHGLANVYRSIGQWDLAEPLFQKAVDIYRKLTADKPNENLITCLCDLVLLYINQERWQEAELLCDECHSIYMELFHVSLVREVRVIIMNNYGLIYMAGRKSFKIAEGLFGLALKFSHLVYDNKPHFRMVVILQNSGLACIYQNKLEEAENLFLEAVKMAQKLFNDSANYELSMCFHNLGLLYIKQEKYREAKNFLSEAIKINHDLFPDSNHLNLVINHQHYALCLFNTQDYVESAKHFTIAARVEINVIADRFQGQTETERLAYRDRRQFSIDYLLSCLWYHLAEDTEAIAAAFEVIYLWKSIATAAEVALSAAISRSDDLELKQLAVERQQLTRQIIQITKKPPTENLEAYREEVKRLKAELNRCQKEIAAKVPQYDMMETTVDRQVIDRLVPAGAVLIDFVRFDLYDIIDNRVIEEQYLAFILGNDGLDKIKLVKLGTAAKIDELITNFRQVASDLDALDAFDRMGVATGARKQNLDLLLIPYQICGNELRQAIFDPLNLSADKDRVIFAPDGDLNLVPFGILPQDDGILSDRFSVRYISASRDLSPRLQPPPPASIGTIFANPNYDFPHPASICQTSTIEKSGTFSTLGSKLIPIPQTESFARKIAQGLGISCYSGDEAHTTNLRQLRSPRYLVIATHGLHGLDSEGGDRADPMQDTALALTGYNTYLSGGTLPSNLENGFFTARAVLELDLWGNQIAILLACSSGTGAVRQGEGIFGLKRALAIAGVNTLIVSLWDVPIEASILLMDKFFGYYRDGKGMPAAIALKEAQAFIRNISRTELENIDRGRTILKEIDEIIPSLREANKPLQHPVFWGAWICQDRKEF
jgi:tetratricopeptide (TPR) repeat protein/CHAT domain-containing protein